MPRTIEGVVRGGRIELIDGPELAEGQHVRVVIEAESIATGLAENGPTSEKFVATNSAANGLSPEEGVIHTPAGPQLLALLEQIRKTRKPLPPSPTGPGRKSSAGCMADDPTWDEHLHEIMEARKSSTYREPLE